MTDAKASGVAPKTINLSYEMVDGVLQIDIRSEGLQDDPNLIAMHLALALDRMTSAAVSE